MIVADTDVLIDALRGREPARKRVEEEIRRRTLGTTAVTAFELRSGIRSEKQRDRVESLLDVLPVLALDDRASAVAAGLRLNLEAAGRAIGMADYLIAGICVRHGAPLLTRNRRHFERVPDLVVAELEELPG